MSQSEILSLICTKSSSYDSYCINKTVSSVMNVKGFFWMSRRNILKAKKCLAPTNLLTVQNSPNPDDKQDTITSDFRIPWMLSWVNQVYLYKFTP